jgi:hypothetical protein
MAHAEAGMRQRDLVPYAIRRESERLEHAAYLAAHRVRSVEFVSEAGMLAASNLSSLQTRLAADVPEAAGRLAAIGEVALAAIAAEIRWVAR